MRCKDTQCIKGQHTLKACTEGIQLRRYAIMQRYVNNCLDVGIDIRRRKGALHELTLGARERSIQL